MTIKKSVKPKLVTVAQLSDGILDGGKNFNEKDFTSCLAKQSDYSGISCSLNKLQKMFPYSYINNHEPLKKLKGTTQK